MFDSLMKVGIFMFDFGLTGLICMAFAQYNPLFVCATIPCGIIAGYAGMKIYDNALKDGKL